MPQMIPMRPQSKKRETKFETQAVEVPSAPDTFVTTTPALASLPTGYAGSGYQDYSDSQVGDSVASGVPLQVGNSLVGVMMNDAQVGEKVALLTRGKMWLKVDPAAVTATFNAGDNCYIWPAATATVGGMVTNDDDTGSNTRIGTFVLPSTQAVEISGGAPTTPYLGNATWVIVSFEGAK